jgi:hypothetical protein
MQTSITKILWVLWVSTIIYEQFRFGKTRSKQFSHFLFHSFNHTRCTVVVYFWCTVCDSKLRNCKK